MSTSYTKETEELLALISSVAPKVSATFQIISSKYHFHIAKGRYALGNSSGTARKWYPRDPVAVEYCKGYRVPSCTYPHSYLQACSTERFFALYYGYNAVDMSAWRCVVKYSEKIRKNPEQKIVLIVSFFNAAKKIEKKLSK